MNAVDRAQPAETVARATGGDARRARILAMNPAVRADLAALIRQRLDQTAERITRLREDEAALTEWLAEFAPEMLP